TTEGTAIYLPPYVNTFEEQRANFQVYKVFTTHQAGRLEFGSFRYRWDEAGAFAPASMAGREAEHEAAAREEAAAAPLAEGVEPNGETQQPRAATTEMQRYFNLFPDRLLISGLFTVVEDTRVDAYVAREYGGIRRWLRQMQSYEADHRPEVRAMG